MPPLSIKTYQRFSEFLNKRIETRQHLTEDSVRYAFFLAATQTTDIEQHELILELPHPKFPGKEIDTYVVPNSKRKPIFIEFKFHRTSKSTSPKPQKAGSLFKDISRLASLITPESQCFVVYLTCSEMAKYFENNENAYSGFWRQPTGANFLYDETFVAKTTDTFRKVSGDHYSARVHVAFSSSLNHDYSVRIFDIQRI